jgi:hypothetical protein
LAALAAHLASEQRDEALREALAVAKAIGDEGGRSEALATLAPHLAPYQLGEALAAAEAIGDEHARSRALHKGGPIVSTRNRALGRRPKLGRLAGVMNCG